MLQKYFFDYNSKGSIFKYQYGLKNVAKNVVGVKQMNLKEISKVKISLVRPSVKNPRVDNGFCQEEMEKILKQHGWLMPISVYRKGKYFVIFSGHRRWMAAKNLGFKEIPVNVQPAPLSEEEEYERIGDTQTGQIDWGEFEWAVHTKGMKDRLKISAEELALRMGEKVSKIRARLNVMNYYLETEIEHKLENKTYSIRMLDYIRGWIVKLQKVHPQLVEDLGEQEVKEYLLKKYEDGAINSYISGDKSINYATEEQIFEFLIDSKKSLNELKKEVRKNKPKVKNFKTNAEKLDLLEKEIASLDIRNKRDAEKLTKALEELHSVIEEKKKYMEEIQNQKKNIIKGVA